MTIRSKPCKAEGCRGGRFGGDYCLYHQELRTDAKWLRQQAARAEKAKSRRPVAMPRRSKKRLKQESQYSVDRKEFLARPENRMCRVFPWKEATEIHHMKGKIGELLLDQRWWLPVSRPGHEKIENSPIWAKENGFSLDRLY
jgi:hypothetical protein